MEAQVNRRHFLKATAAAAATAAVTGPFIGRASGAAASERVRLGYIACGGRARQMLPMFLSDGNMDLVAVSDVNEPRMDQTIEMAQKIDANQKPERILDYRKMLERKDLDGVVIATTQHWHGLPHIHAAQAGKAIFVEKPLSHTVEEGRAMVRATKKYNVLSMMGTQQRIGPHYQQAVQLVQSGRLGKVALVECWNYHNTGARVGRSQDSEVPAGLHWDMWLGPAPYVPYNRSRMSNSWWFDYAGGMMTNWAIHHIDIILWAMNSYSPTAVACSGGKYVVDDMADCPDTIEASWEFPGWLMQYSYRGFNSYHKFQSRPNHHGICFQGDKATLILDRHGFEIWDGNKQAEKVSGIPYMDQRDAMRSEQDGPWQRLFVQCIREKRSTPLDLEDSHKGTVCCHLANISYLVGRKVQWDAASESIPGDSQAAALLSRPRRKGYELPAV
jgi:predicted dehydrogenase